MKSKQVRHIVFFLHRYLGLVVGLLLVIVGLTGSLLVFQREIDQFLVSQQFGQIIAQGDRLPLTSILENVKTAYASQPNLKISSINTLPNPLVPYRVFLQAPKDKWLEVFVNPYTGAIMGSRDWDQTLIGYIFKLHYQLLADETGTIIVGVVAFVLLIVSITGIILWPGWRRFISGFKIKWNAHPQRVNFDIHKVAGMIAGIFLSMIAFTGVCWNFWDFSKPLIHTVTMTPIPSTPVSQPIKGKLSLSLGEILQKADTAFPGAVTTYISLPQTPEAVFRIGKKLPQETTPYGSSRIYLDQYTGAVVQLKNGLQPSRADRILDSFTPIHYGTFWGLPSRIFYVFVGLTPLILFITGFMMWRYRRQNKGKSAVTKELVH